jgi:hypothetical protein
LEFKFTSSAFAGLVLTETFDAFDNGGVNATLIGDTITLDWAGTDGPAGFLREATFSLTPNSAVPVPAALPLFATGLGALGLLGWRRKRKAAAAS